MAKEEKKEESKTELNVEELKLISQVLYNSTWTGQQWEGIIKPLINKIAKIIDESK